MFIIFIIILVSIYWVVSSSPRNYEMSYDVNAFSVVESYQKDNGFYNFKISNDEYSFVFMNDNKYSKSRKLVSEIYYEEIDKYLCLSALIDEEKTQVICSDGTSYTDYYLLNEEESINIIDVIDNVYIYNKDYDYLLWNGYGITNIIDGTSYNFLENESYDNNLSYRLNDYIIFADYDASREFNTFYIYDKNNEKIIEWEFDYNISTSSYFMGDVDEYIYLFDKKNKIQYKINIEKQTIEISSDEDGAMFYDNEWTSKTLNNLSYNELLFNYNNLYNFILEDNILYYKYINSDTFIKISDNNITDIIYYNDYNVIYLIGDKLYVYNIFSGNKLLLEYFEWNFSYSNKIYVF